MKYLLAAITLFGLSACIGAGKNTELHPQGSSKIPHMTGIDLTGQERPIPESLDGKLNILVFAFQREQQENVNTWIPRAEGLMTDFPELRFYEIPLIYEMNGLMRGWVNNGMRAGVKDTVSRERTITVYTDREQFLNLMDMREETIYTVLVDETGNVLWRQEGDATDEKVESLRTAIEGQLK